MFLKMSIILKEKIQLFMNMIRHKINDNSIVLINKHNVFF